MMGKLELPKSSDWNSYWSADQTQKFTKISWSKKRIIKILSPYAREGKFALDAGCGSGFFSKYFCDNGMDTYSLDYSDEALKIAQDKTNGRTSILKKDLLHCDLKNEIVERFDLIFTDGLFEHFSYEDQSKIFTNLKSVLNDNGVIITFVPNRFSPWELIRPFYMPGIKEDPFVLKQLVALNVNHGMRIIQQGGINTFPFAFSPDKSMGHLFGMLLFTVSQHSH